MNLNAFSIPSIRNIFRSLGLTRCKLIKHLVNNFESNFLVRERSADSTTQRCFYPTDRITTEIIGASGSRFQINLHRTFIPPLI